LDWPSVINSRMIIDVNWMKIWHRCSTTVVPHRQLYSWPRAAVRKNAIQLWSCISEFQMIKSKNWVFIFEGE
jgi:hypothetical protein